MTFRDQWATNDKGDQFLFTVEMQRALKEAGLPVEAEQLEQLPANVLRDLSAPVKAGKRKDAGEPDAIQIDAASGKFIGRVKMYRRDRGYGFIARGDGDSVFFHRSKTLDDPESYGNQEWVLYEIRDTDRGTEAYDVERYERDSHG